MKEIRVPQNLLSKQEEKSRHRVKHRKISYLPLAISVQRLVFLPFLILSLQNEFVFVADSLFLFVIATDFADGYIARKMGISSKLGSRLDATIDFCFIFCMFLYFVAQGFYSMWVLFLIAVAFAQFLLSSLFSRLGYDPVGKYYGSLLYGAVGLTLLFSGKLAHEVVTAGIIVATATLFLSRLLCLAKT
jgi:phosphatidylglycerophosphate synthase